MKGKEEYKAGTRVWCCDEEREFCDELYLKPNGEWENITQYTMRYGGKGDIKKYCQHVEVIEKHEINDKPTDIERVALTLLAGARSTWFGEPDELNEKIEAHVNDLLEDENYDKRLFLSGAEFDEFSRKYRSTIGWEAFFLANDVAKYRELGRPTPPIALGHSIGFGIRLEENLGIPSGRTIDFIKKMFDIEARCWLEMKRLLDRLERNKRS